MAHNLFNSLQSFNIRNSLSGNFYSLPELERQGVGQISRLPVSIRIVLESVLRNYDGERITEDNGDIAVPWETESLCFALGCLDQVAILASDIGSAKIIAEACYPRPANNMGFFHWVNSF